MLRQTNPENTTRHVIFELPLEWEHGQQMAHAQHEFELGAPFRM